MSITEKVIHTVKKVISESPGQSLEKEYLARACGITEENAAKNIASFKKLGLLDEGGGVATPLGTRWARTSTCASATEEVIASVFPVGMGCFPSDASNEAVVPFLVENGGVSGEVAKKNAAAFRLLRQVSIEAARECDREALSKTRGGNAKGEFASSAPKTVTFHLSINSSDELIARLLRIAKQNNVAIDMDIR